MKPKAILTFFSILFILISCDKPVKTFPLTIVTTENIGNKKTDKYPQLYVKLCNPIETEKEIKYNFAPYPIFIKRLGISNGDIMLKIIADESKSNTDNLNYRRNVATKFFQDSLIGEVMSLPVPSDFNKDNYIANYISTLNKKTKFFYYSEMSQMDELNGQKIYDNDDSLISSIKLFLSENLNADIAVIINPEPVNSTNPPSPQKSNDSTVTTPPPPPSPNNSSIKIQVRTALLKLINSQQYSEQQRLGFADEEANTFFAKDFYVVMHDDDARSLSRTWNSGQAKDYLHRLATYNSTKDFEILSAHKNPDGKVTDIEVVEKH